MYAHAFLRHGSYATAFDNFIMVTLRECPAAPVDVTVVIQNYI